MSLIRRVVVDRQLVKREMPVLLVTTALVPLSLLDGVVSTIEACALLALACGYTAWVPGSGMRGSSVVATAMLGAAQARARNVATTWSRA